MPQTLKLAVIAGFMLCWAHVGSLNAAEAPRVEAVAFAGKPFGVGMVRIDFPAERYAASVGEQFGISTTQGRVFYPALALGEVGPRGSYYPRVAWAEIYFLIPDDSPLQGTVHLAGWAEQSHLFSVTPKQDPAAASRLLDRWWNTYQHARLGAMSQSQCHPLVENYTSGMLARRLNRTLPPPIKNWSWWGADGPIGYLIGTEEVRLAMQRDRLLDTSQETEQMNRPMPVPVLPPPVTIPAFEDPTVEPLAAHVPAECFYARFRNYPNYRWFRNKLDQLGDRVTAVSVERGIDYGITERLQTQLAINENALTEVISEQAIADLAVIGNDTFMREGAAVGVLFQAKQNLLLHGAISTQRQLAKAQPDVLVVTETLGGHEVSFLSTPDNRVRSFYAIDGDYHLVTNSRTMVKRFYEAGAGTGALAGEAEFRYARTQSAHDRPEAAFIYLSDRFFRELVGPHYRVEMSRRAQADTDLELVELAWLAAKNENAQHATVEQLVAGGFMSNLAIRRPDGSRILGQGDGFVDSLRGARRTFLPVPDIQFTGNTPTEETSYKEFADAYRRLYTRMDPVVVSIDRQVMRQGVERIVADVSITPYTFRGIGGLRGFLSPASLKMVPTLPGELFSVHMGAAWPEGRAQGDPLHLQLRAGLMGHEQLFMIERGQVRPAALDGDIFNRSPFVFGTSSIMPFKGFVPELKDAQPDAEGYFDAKVSFLNNIVGRQLPNGWVVLSPRKEVLQTVTPGWESVDAERPAQLRVHVGDLSASQLAPIIRAEEYLRTRSVSESNAYLFHKLNQQLGVQVTPLVAKPPGKLENDRGNWYDSGTTMQAATRILAGKPACPLGGEYQFSTDHRFVPRWRSQVWKDGQFSVLDLRTIPADYSPKVLSTFHGLGVEITLGDQTLRTRVQLDLRAD